MNSSQLAWPQRPWLQRTTANSFPFISNVTRTSGWWTQKWMGFLDFCWVLHYGRVELRPSATVASDGIWSSSEFVRFLVMWIWLSWNCPSYISFFDWILLCARCRICVTCLLYNTYVIRLFFCSLCKVTISKYNRWKNPATASSLVFPVSKTSNESDQKNNQMEDASTYFFLIR